MPISYRIDTSKGVIFTEAWGEITEATLQSHRGNMANDPDFRPDYWCLEDLRRVTKFDVSVEFIKRLSIDLMFKPGSRAAFVYQDDYSFALTRVYSAKIDESGVELRPFRDMAEARRWLKLT